MSAVICLGGGAQCTCQLTKEDLLQNTGVLLDEKSNCKSCQHAVGQHQSQSVTISSAPELYGCYAKDCDCISYVQGVKFGECQCGHPAYQHAKIAGFKTPPKAAARSDIMSSTKRRQEKLKDKIIYRQGANPDGSNAICDICGRPCQRSVATVAHIIPHSMRALIYTDQHIGGQRLCGKLHSPTDVHNALWLCRTCDGAYESHDINIDETGTIRTSEKFLTHCDEVYKKLNGHKVWWSKYMSMKVTEYPPGEVLSYRMKHIPPVHSKEGKELQKKLYLEWEKTQGVKRKLSEFDHESDEDDYDPDDDDGDDDHMDVPLQLS